MNLSHFVKEYENSLSSEMCKEMIKRFELDSRKGHGQVSGGYKPDVKKSIDLDISSHPEWFNIVESLKKELIKCAKDYTSCISKMYDRCINPLDEDGLFSFFDSVRIKDFNIQKTEPGGGYIWHNDDIPFNRRHLVFIWYLNTVEPECGGSTDILNNDISIQPVEGKLLIFPSSWLFVHRGRLLKKGVKYICTGWITD